MFSIMVVEDDGSTRKLMEHVLKNGGYDVVTACDGIEALDMLETKHVDLILLDVMMPRMDGYEMARILREGNCMIPIIMVTAKEAQADKRQGFVSGVDDYMVKPVDEEELLLRINALLRRAHIASEKQLVIGQTVLKYDAHTVTDQTGEQILPSKEFLLLFKLLSYPDKIFTRRQLMDEVWDMETESDERTVDVHINRLRERFKNNRDFSIVTVRGLGYKAAKE